MEERLLCAPPLYLRVTWFTAVSLETPWKQDLHLHNCRFKKSYLYQS